ncbi:MAG: patatin-like phospholipase family protein [Cupriavidus sp.]|nr:MAG: patatin-like phospholipase family protein [Cupriavidus sp.]
MVFHPTLQEELRQLGQQVLVFQGGGALGAYQAGVYEALHKAGIELDWVIGTSIGAINASIIAGNAPADRMDRLRAFWKRVEFGGWLDDCLPDSLSTMLRYWSAVTTGIPGFFEPNFASRFGLRSPLDSDQAGYYSVGPLRDTLGELVDFEIANAGTTRLTVGASNVSTSEMVYFDSREETLDMRHILASGALPPAFPPVRIGDAYFWDGGVLSNTPVEMVFDDNPRRDSVIYSVHIWNPEGPPPRSMHDVMNRYKDVQYSSRSASHIKRQRQLHRLRHIITEIADHLTEEAKSDPRVQSLLGYGCKTRMHVVRLLAPRLGYEDHSKDVDFSPSSIRQRWEAGYAHTMRMLDSTPWRADADPVEGFILHETMAGHSVVTAAAME